MRVFLRILVFVLVLGMGGLVQAQVPGDTVAPFLSTHDVMPPGPPEGSGTPEWGVANPTCLVIPSWVFNNLMDAQHGRNSGYIYRATGWPYFDHTIWLPTGVEIYGITTFFYDVSASADIGFYIYRASGYPTTGWNLTQIYSRFSSGDSGYQGGYAVLDTFETVRNYDRVNSQYNTYLLIVEMDSSEILDLRFGGVAIWYQLQVSPAPATATFNDVPTNHAFFPFVEALVASGITAGCGGGNYCPDDPVTRGQMAVYLSAALGLYWAD